MGALTFHFPAKTDLAHAVRTSGLTATRRVLRQTNKRSGGALDSVVDLTHVLAQLLAESVEVRAAARLDHELQDTAPVWRSEWSAALQNLLEKAKRQGTSPADLEAIELLATYLVVGAEAAIRAGAPYSSVQEQLTRLWTLIDVDEVDPSDSQGQHPGRVALL